MNYQSTPSTNSCSSPRAIFEPLPISPACDSRNSAQSYLQLYHQVRTQSISRQKPNQNHRALFALQIKYLLQVLKNAREDILLQECKNCISMCTRMNRAGDSSFSPLETVLESHLRSLAGNLYWELAQSNVKQHIRQSQYRKQCAAAVALQNAALIRARRNSVAI